MTIPNDLLHNLILSTQRIHYAVFDGSLCLVELSQGFKDSFPADWPLESGEKVSNIFQELAGYENVLLEIIGGGHDPLVLERIIKLPLEDRPVPMIESQAEYYALHAYPYHGSLLIIVRDVTNEGSLEQQVIQQRNEMDLLTGRLIEDLRRANDELNQAYMVSLTGWAAAVDLLSGDPPGHGERLVRLTRRMAETMGVSREEQKFFGYGALLHDIGQMSVPEAILRKPGPLTREEREIMERHPVHASDLLSPITFLQKSLDIPRSHHEKWDGTGYPSGLKAEEIPLSARIFAVVDVYDALTSPRPYRAAWTQNKALAYIKEQSGVHFDPVIVRYFLAIVEESPDPAP